MLVSMVLLESSILIGLSYAQTQAGWPWASHGVLTDMGADTVSTGNDLVNSLYGSCQLYTGDNTVIAFQQQCVSVLVGYMMNAMASAASGTNVGYAETNPGNVQESATPGRKHSEEHHLIRRVNEALAGSSTTDLRAVSISPSDVLLRNGLATNLNVRSADRTLAVHTNGTHATAAFTSDTGVGRRAFLPTNYQYFKFIGVDGLKMTARDINSTITSEYLEDLETLTKGFTTSTTGSAIFQKSDAWTYGICNNDVMKPLFYGRVIVEEIYGELTYEDLSAPNCVGINKLAGEMQQSIGASSPESSLVVTNTASSSISSLSSAEASSTTAATSSTGAETSSAAIETSSATVETSSASTDATSLSTTSTSGATASTT